MSPLAQAVRSTASASIPSPSRRITVAWMLAVLATVADVSTTALGTGAGHPERNPVVADVLTAAGVPGFVLLKALILLAAAGIGARYFDRATVAPTVLAVAWGSVATLNLTVLAGA